MSDGLSRCKCGFVMPGPLHYPCKSGGTLKETYAHPERAARSAHKDFGGSMTDFERGAEAMREAAAKGLEDRYGYGWGSFIATVRALPLPVQPPGSESREARMERENTRLLECMAVVYCPVCKRRVWVEGEAPSTLTHHFTRGRVNHGPKCEASGKTLPEAFALTSDKSPDRKPDVRPEEKK